MLIEANEPALLAAYVLKYQRESHGLSLADAARALGVSSRNAYARYEQGTSVPTIDKFAELLQAVAPEVVIIVGNRLPTKAKRRIRSVASSRRKNRTA